jgi:hypothetical protein
MATSIENIVKYYTDRDLSGAEIQKLIGKPPVLYSDLTKYTFNTFFPKNAPYQVVLLQTKAINFGHYVACFLADDAIYYSDSYGLGAPDTYKSYTKFDEEYPPLLKNLLATDPQRRPVISNTVDYQQWGRAQCCGRWAALRILFRGLTNPQFESIFRGNKGFLNRPDYVATMLTLNGLDNIQEYFEK